MIKSIVVWTGNKEINTTYKYNNLNQVIETKDWNWNKTDYEYNYLGNITQKTNTIIKLQ